MRNRDIDQFAEERKIRDLYAKTISSQRPSECLLSVEPTYSRSRLRADMRTLDRNNVVREWEFKLYAHYQALGQVLVYLALCREEHGFGSQVRPVLAAFAFSDEILRANEILNLGVEFVQIPA